MKIHVFNRDMAAMFKPARPTLAIRIFNGQTYNDGNYRPLKKSPLYIKVLKYTFDDFNPEEVSQEELSDFIANGLVLFNKNIATNILRSFERHYLGVEEIMIHCKEGMSRSPAVALALNEVYNLDCDLSFFQCNEYVYKTIIEVARARYRERYNYSKQL